MAGFLAANMKRKDLEGDLFDGFSDFSHSSPARKIRRLDDAMPPILEEEPEFSEAFKHQPCGEDPFDMKDDIEWPVTVVSDIGLPVQLNHERALVLYEPVNAASCVPLLDSKAPVSSDLSYTVDSDFITGLKNQLTPRPSTTFLQDVGTSDILALVPWVPSSHLPEHNIVAVQAAVEAPCEPMEAEDMETEMDEDMKVSIAASQHAGMGIEGLRRQQQHCMTPQPPHSTPIMWSW